MIIGDAAYFAIESGFSKAYEQPSSRALGWFRIHIGGHGYGVHAPDATLLACSFDEIERRISCRGRHTAPFASEPSPAKIADAVYDACYALEHAEEEFFQLPAEELSDLVYTNQLVWAPDGDEAFDDGSHVLQFDVDDRVRLIGFKGSEHYRHQPGRLSEVWLSANDFYALLDQWRAAFVEAWRAAPKVRDGAGTL